MLTLLHRQEFSYGPVGPANVGELRSPPSVLRADITLKTSGKVIDKIYGPKFEGVSEAKIAEGQGFSTGVAKTDKAFYKTHRFKVVGAHAITSLILFVSLRLGCRYD